MSDENTKLGGPDFAMGVAGADLAECGMILGQVAGEAVLLARSGGAVFAIGAECSHYHGPLAEGVLVADTVRCPWHHACFSQRTMVMAALGTDREHRATAAREQHRFPRDLARDHAAFGEIRAGDPFRQIGSSELFILFAHDCLLPPAKTPHCN